MSEPGHFCEAINMRSSNSHDYAISRDIKEIKKTVTAVQESLSGRFEKSPCLLP